MSKGKSIPQDLYNVNFYYYEVTYFITTQLVMLTGIEPVFHDWESCVLPLNESMIWSPWRVLNPLL